MTIATDLATGLAALARLDPATAPLPADAVDRLVAYLDLLVKWNRTYNLTAIREPARMVTHHLLDALAVLPHLPRRTGRQGQKAAHLQALARQRVNRRRGQPVQVDVEARGLGLGVEIRQRRWRVEQREDLGDQAVQPARGKPNASAAM